MSASTPSSRFVLLKTHNAVIAMITAGSSKVDACLISVLQGESREQLLERGDEERRCDHVIRASRRRDALVAAKLLDKMTTILRSPSGAWSQDDKSAEAP